MNSVAFRPEQFTDSKELRGQYINRTEVLDKIKVLSLLPDNEHFTVRMIADYYEVDVQGIRKVIQRHRDELALDGIKTLTGEDLKKFKASMGHNFLELKRVPSAILLNRRCCLRIGMLLRDSEIAKKVRSYLLNIEERSTQEQKSIATKGSNWDGLDLILYDIIHTEVMCNNGTLTSACEKASKQLNKTVGACMNRYSSHIKNIIRNEELVSKIEGNRGRGQLKVIDSKKNDLSLERPAFIDELYFNAVVQEISNISEYIKKLEGIISPLLYSENDLLKSKLMKLESELEQYKSKYKSLLKKCRVLQSELNSTRAVISAAVKVRVDDEITNTFRMDKNGNLERI